MIRSLFVGGLSRKQYLIRCVASLITLLLLLGLIVFIFRSYPSGTEMVLATAFLAISIEFYQISLAVRRLRDAGHSSWWALLMLISPINFVLTVLLLILPTKTIPDPLNQPVKNGSVPLLILVFLLLLAVIGTGSYFLFTKIQEQNTQIAILQKENQLINIDSEVCNKDIRAEKKAFTGEWTTFNDSNFPFSFRYPKNWFIDKKSPGEVDPEEIDSFVRVSSCKDKEIEKCPGQYFEFLIAKIGPIPNKANNTLNKRAAYYAFKMWEESEIDQAKDCEASTKKYGSCILPTPGFVNVPLNSETIFTFDDSSVVDAVKLGCYGCGGDSSLGNKFILASKENLYKVYLNTNVFSKGETQLTANDIDNPLLELVRSLILK